MDDELHCTAVLGRTGDYRARAACLCGWTGPLREGRDCRWQATADADDHMNEAAP